MKKLIFVIQPVQDKICESKDVVIEKFCYLTFQYAASEILQVDMITSAHSNRFKLTSSQKTRESFCFEK
jgi:hypothetical protein